MPRPKSFVRLIQGVVRERVQDAIESLIKHAARAEEEGGQWAAQA